MGLQAVIGQDLKLLLKGWVGWKKRNKPLKKINKYEKQNTNLFNKLWYCFKNLWSSIWQEKNYIIYFVLGWLIFGFLHKILNKAKEENGNGLKILSEKGQDTLQKFNDYLSQSILSWFNQDILKELPEFIIKIIEFILNPNQDIQNLFLIIVCIIIFVLPIVCLRFIDRTKTKVLLIVDDLDRLPSNELLEIIESLKVLLEDEEISQLIQIVIICEERSLSAALNEKYKYLYHHQSNLQEDELERFKKDLIEENIQKLFISYLRLPPLAKDEQQEILRKFIDYKPDQKNLEITNKSQSQTDTETNTSSKSGETTSELNRNKSFEEAPSFWMLAFLRSAESLGLSLLWVMVLQKIEPDKNNNALPKIDFSEDEKKALYDSLDELQKWVNLAPRAIYSFIFRYQLARQLLHARKRKDIDSSYLAYALAMQLSRQEVEINDQDIQNVLDEVI